MTAVYRNVMEELVETRVNELWCEHQGCKCDRCKQDVIAFTLNHLPPQYVVTDEGELFTKVRHLEVRHEFEITKQIAVAMKIIGDKPHHD